MFEKKMGNKRGQVTIFIIMGIVIVAFTILVYTFYPKIKTTLGVEESNPQSYFQLCMEEKFSETIAKISAQGGSINPDLYSSYKEVKIGYLGYTGEYFSTSVVQIPMLMQHLKREIKEGLSKTAIECFNSLQESYVGKGYGVERQSGNERVNFFKNKIEVVYNYPFTFTKGEEVQRYDSFIIRLNNNLYELALIANDILYDESTLGDSDIEEKMIYNPNIKVERILKESGDKVYIITDRKTEDEFWFAIRSQSWAGGILLDV